MRSQLVLATATLACSLLGGCGMMPAPDTGGIATADAWAPPTPAGVSVGAVYLAIASTPGDRLESVEVSPDVAARAEMHEIARGPGGELSMRRVATVELPPGQRVEFRPGGRHVMLLGLARPLTVGDIVTLRLRCSTAGLRTIRVPVRPR